MPVYSPFFHTLYDQAEPIGQLGRGTHYSVLRAVLPLEGGAAFHDFAVIWDEDHDERVIYVAEQLYVKGMLRPILAIGERKGTVTALTKDGAPPKWIDTVHSVLGAVPEDDFGSEVGVFPSDPRGIINDNHESVRSYLAGIDALWKLGTKDCTFWAPPFRPHTPMPVSKP